MGAGPWGDQWGDSSTTSALDPLLEHAAKVTVKKQDVEQQLVFAEVFAPGFPDSQGDFMRAEAIQKMAYEFMRKGHQHNIDLHHSQMQSGCYVVESFIAREDDKVFIPGSWVLGVHIPDPEIWSLVKSGDLNGFSFDGLGVRVATELEIDMPDVILGKTDVGDGHTHSFEVRYSDDGSFLGGCTDAGPDGHVHSILRGTVTEDFGGHNHRFSFIEGVLNAQVAN